VSGSAKVLNRDEEGREVILTLLGAGECFGEMGLIDGSPRSADVVATADVECRVIGRSLFEDIGKLLPALKAKILNEIALQLCDRLRQANIEISALRS